MSLQHPRGTRDFTPEETAVRRHLETTMREAFQGFGFQEIQTPTFEHLELFTAKSGEGIVDELYRFEDKGGREMTLRPELTAPVMRFYYSELAMRPKPLKLFYYGNCFRYDRPQKGRYREFWQMGCELIGADTPEAIAEVFTLGTALLRRAGLQGLVARIGHLGVLRGVLDHMGWPATSDRGALMRAIDKWDEKQVRSQLDGAGVAPAHVDWFLAMREAKDVAALRRHLEAAPPAAGAETGIDDARASVDVLGAVLDAAARLGADMDAVTVDPMIARGLDYYTGVVFEMDAPALGAEKQLLGGGVYDLSGVFGGEGIGQVGFGLGFDRTLVALEAEGVAQAPDRRLDVYVVPIGDQARPTAFEQVARLREAGLRAEVDLMRRAPGKNFKFADSRGARHTVILGQKEVAEGIAAVKDLASGEQETVPLDGLVRYLRERAAA